LSQYSLTHHKITNIQHLVTPSKHTDSPRTNKTLNIKKTGDVLYSNTEERWINYCCVKRD